MIKKNTASRKKARLAKLVIPGSLFEPDVILETKPISVDVRPLPEDAPVDFSGAVGQFELTASLSEVEGKVNEPVTLIVDITGTGNIETLAEPALPELPNWSQDPDRAAPD